MHAPSLAAIAQLPQVLLACLRGDSAARNFVTFLQISSLKTLAKLHRLAVLLEMEDLDPKFVLRSLTARTTIWSIKMSNRMQALCRMLFYISIYKLGCIGICNKALWSTTYTTTVSTVSPASRRAGAPATEDELSSSSPGSRWRRYSVREVVSSTFSSASPSSGNILGRRYV